MPSSYMSVFFQHYSVRSSEVHHSILALLNLSNTNLELTALDDLLFFFFGLRKAVKYLSEGYGI